MTLKKDKFGSEVELSDKFLKEIADSGIVEAVVEVHKAKEKTALAKDVKGTKRNKI